MGICAPLTELLMLRTLQTKYNHRLMMANETKMSISTKLGDKIVNLNDREIYENELLETEFENECGDLDTSTEEYTQCYQAFETAKEDLSKVYDRLVNEVQNELNRKEQSMDLEIEQIETQLEAIDADANGIQSLVDNNVKDEFSYFE